MSGIPVDYQFVFIGVFTTLLITQLLFTFYLFRFIRQARIERSDVHKEMYGLVRKLEGLTSSKREQMLQHYDTILDDLTNRLPLTIAAQAGEIIFETESKILSRLAELEPSLNEDDRGQEKMDQLIKSMENLESTIVRLTADTVHDVFAENRKNLFEEHDMPLAKAITKQRIPSETPYS